MALKQDGVIFVLCPKQGNKIKGFSQTGYVFKGFSCLNRVRVSNPQRLTSTTPPPPFPQLAQFCSKKSRRNHQSCVWREASEVSEEKYPVFARARKLLWREHILKLMSIAFNLVFFYLKCWITTHGILTCNARIQRWRPHSVTLQNYLWFFS